MKIQTLIEFKTLKTEVGTNKTLNILTEETKKNCIKFLAETKASLCIREVY